MGMSYRGVAALGLWVAMGLGASAGIAAGTEGEFVITPWELPPRTEGFGDKTVGLGSLKECGFTTAAFVREEDVPECRRLGLKALVRDNSFAAKWVGLTDAQFEERVRKLVGKTAHDETVVGYFLQDEPGASEFPALGKAVAWVKKLAPGKLAYINLFPDYATMGGATVSQLEAGSYHEYLERYVAEVRPQFISYDNYAVPYARDMKDAGWAVHYFPNLVEVRRVALEHGLPFWNVVAGAEILKDTAVPSPANLLMQAYTTLAAGGRGVTWYTYYGGGYRYAAVEGKARTATWGYLRMVNEQVRVVGKAMEGLESVGVYFSGSAPGVEGMGLPGKFVKEVKAEGPVMVGEFEGKGGRRYAMVVNLNLEKSVRVVVKSVASGEIKQVSPVDGSEMGVDDGEAVWLVAGQGVLLKMPQGK